MDDAITLSESEQAQYDQNWKRLDYGEDIFLNWHKIDRSRIASIEQLPVGHVLSKDDSYIYLDVKFAEKWWDASKYDPYEALKWVDAGHTPEQVLVFREVGFRSPKTVGGYFAELGLDPFVQLAQKGLKFPKSGSFKENIAEVISLVDIAPGESESEAADPISDKQTEEAQVAEATESVESHSIEEDQVTEPGPVDEAELTKQSVEPLSTSTELVSIPAEGVMVRYGDTTHIFTASSVVGAVKEIVLLPFKIASILGRRLLKM